MEETALWSLRRDSPELQKQFCSHTMAITLPCPPVKPHEIPLEVSPLGQNTAYVLWVTVTKTEFRNSPLTSVIASLQFKVNLKDVVLYKNATELSQMKVVRVVQQDSVSSQVEFSCSPEHFGKLCQSCGLQLCHKLRTQSSLDGFVTTHHATYLTICFS